MKFDVTSDLHMDFWVDHRNPEPKQVRLMTQLFEGSLLPQTPSSTLVIAGDVGHYNHQNSILFSVLRKYYQHVIWVAGNHDLYMVSQNIGKKFEFDSFNRLNDMVRLSDMIDGVNYLNGNTIEIDGIVFGGSSGWYDGAYAYNVWGYNTEATIQLWSKYMTDFKLIRTKNEFSKNIYHEFDFLKYSDYQKELLKQIAPACDIMISHIAPDWTHIKSKYNTPGSTFYAFDGREILASMKEKSAWVFGHTHEKHFYNSPYGPTMICNPLGYPSEDGMMSIGLERHKFLTVDTAELGPVNYEEIFKNA